MTRSKATASALITHLASRFTITRQSHARGLILDVTSRLISSVSKSACEGVWIELTPGEYSDDGVIDTIIDWRYREEMDTEMAA